MDALLRIDHTQQRSVRCREGVLLFMLRESRTPEKHAVFALFHAKSFKNSLKHFCCNGTISLSFYGKIGVCPVRTGRERGDSCGVCKNRYGSTALLHLRSAALRYCEEGIFIC